jgi:hypothetical protein
MHIGPIMIKCIKTPILITPGISACCKTCRISFILFLPLFLHQGQIQDKVEVSCHLKDFFFDSITWKSLFIIIFLLTSPQFLRHER